MLSVNKYICRLYIYFTTMKSTLLKSIIFILYRYHVELCRHVIYILLLQHVPSQYVCQKGNEPRNDKKLLQNHSTTEDMNDQRIYPIYTNKHTCNETYNQCRTLNLQDVNVHGYSDNSVSNEDIVQLQYMKLPYPTIRYKTIEMEYKYYHGQKKKYPLSSQYSMKLEYINHYLYEGKNCFEYVSQQDL